MNPNDEARIWNARTTVMHFELLRLFRDRPHCDHDELTFKRMIQKSQKDIQDLDAAVVLRLYELLRMQLDVDKLLNSTVSWLDIYNLLRKGNIQ